MTSIHDQFSYAVIGTAMETHCELGPGLDEIFYHELMARKLKGAGIPHLFKSRGRLLHRSLVADEFEPDLLIADELAVELKGLWGDFTPEHVLQVICYLKFWNLQAGLLLDFGKESLVIKRVAYYERHGVLEADFLRAVAPAGFVDTETLELLTACLQTVLDEHGLGYRDTTYRGLLNAELSYRQVPFMRDPPVQVRGATESLGEAKLPCFILPGHCVLFVTALRDTRQAADRAVIQTYLKHLNLTWGLHLNFGKQHLAAQFVTQPNKVNRGATSPPTYCAQ
jgi:GxxExxY protein